MAESNFSAGDHWAHFGDGNSAQILDSREYIKKKTGKKFVKFMFKPSIRIEQVYDLIDEQDETGTVVKEYTATEVVWLERGVFRSRCWIYTDFNGGDTPASRRFKELTETINDTERLLRSAEAAKNRSYQELKSEREQKKESFGQIADMVMQIAKARGRVGGEGDEISPDVPD